MTWYVPSYSALEYPLHPSQKFHRSNSKSLHPHSDKLSLTKPSVSIDFPVSGRAISHQNLDLRDPKSNLAQYLRPSQQSSPEEQSGTRLTIAGTRVQRVPLDDESISSAILKLFVSSRSSQGLSAVSTTIDRAARIYFWPGDSARSRTI